MYFTMGRWVLEKIAKRVESKWDIGTKYALYMIYYVIIYYIIGKNALKIGRFLI